ncbi:MAG TPA: FAD-dependent oxidoreductase [Bryobacterales bacterium]|nr:FAD-dependent oxidoreductase [Bryobacterales bacterium]
MERDRALRKRQPTRRQFLGAALIGLARKTDRPVAGSFVNEAQVIGHRLRDRLPFAAPSRRVKIPVVIVGGGMAGLSAAWRLEKRGFRDFVVLEMEKQAGGNSRWGENEISRFPWAAHYVPVPGKRAALVRELFEEFGVLHGGQWEERDLCFSPQERLFLYGRWQYGIEPSIGLTARDREQFQRFERRMAEFRGSGQFTIPMELGSAHADRQALALDQISIDKWLKNDGFDSPHLNWYINYATRDDYGAPAADVSAWAGVHYFASREPEEKGPLTWPEGNGWIVRQLLAKLGSFVQINSVAYRLEPPAPRPPRRWRVLTESTEYLAEAVIFAAPTFILPYVVEGFPPVRRFEYSPWLTANLTLDRFPREQDSEPAWDNVIYDSPGLGYVVATHQTLHTHIERTVWTYYWALAPAAPAQGRRLLLDHDWGYWREAILNDLARAHPDIRSCVSRIDIMRLGHAMVRPRVGFIFSEERRRLAEHTAPGLAPNLFLANSDLSGFSIFEEAQYRGVQAADRVLGLMGGRRHA